MRIHLFLLACAMPFLACSNNRGETSSPEVEVTAADTVASANTALYAEMQQRENCFIVISKLEQKLYVCEAIENDTVRIAEYPVCLGKNIGPKQKKGDMKTPECTWEQPFSISQIQDASTWVHDFGDGRGAILSYGHWFMRLLTPGFSGIGIHGSTNNEDSVPGRASEGCIRLRDDDLLLLKEQYAYKNMKVIIKGEEEGLKPFEQKYY
ncbi:MAG: L,D-transpeptidase family protein [Bacteroidales bacterium]|nr:L,D-transpeptidase family protein [Bacteroidales bacterium]